MVQSNLIHDLINSIHLNLKFLVLQTRVTAETHNMKKIIKSTSTQLDRRKNELLF